MTEAELAAHLGALFPKRNKRTIYGDVVSLPKLSIRGSIVRGPTAGSLQQQAIHAAIEERAEERRCAQLSARQLAARVDTRRRVHHRALVQQGRETLSAPSVIDLSDYGGRNVTERLLSWAAQNDPAFRLKNWDQRIETVHHLRETAQIVGL